MASETVLVGMSGGVDSSVAAYRTLAAGAQTLGATMALWGDGQAEAADARAVARRLGIRHYSFPFQEAFREAVIRPFLDDYAQGRTPNPCVLCNRRLKFGALLEKAQALGCDAVASGHYARLRRDPASGRWLLLRAADEGKDQTYFLAGLTQDQLAHARFPLGDLTKDQVRQIAREQGFLNARKRDSQDICFVPDGDYAAFLEAFTGRAWPSGDFLDLEGRVVGRHRGAVRYTLGQRKGLGLAMGTPVYVCGKDMVRNTVTVGPEGALYARGLLGRDWNWLPFPTLTAPLEVTARIRHSRAEHPATVYPMEDGLAQVEFREPQRAVTPGQAVVLYQGSLVIGGGTIAQALE